AIVEDRATRSAIVAAIAAGYDHGQRVLRSQEFTDLFAKLLTLQEIRKLEVLMLQRIFDPLLQILVAQPLEERLVHGLHVAHGAEKNDLAGQLAAIFVELLFGVGFRQLWLFRGRGSETTAGLLNVDPHRRPTHHAVSRR